MTEIRKLLLATNNQGKVREYRSLLTDVPLRLVSPADEGIAVTVEETGTSFEENAGLKAETLAAESRLLTVADDSGIEVDALGGEPGIYSARYAGENASDAERCRYLLEKLAGVPEENRTARFRCVIALAEAGRQTLYFSGSWEGRITFEPKGNYGFGYDPVLFIPSLGKTVAELEPEVKNRLSHRALAAVKLRRYLLEYFT